MGDARTADRFIRRIKPTADAERCGSHGRQMGYLGQLSSQLECLENNYAIAGGGNELGK